MITEQYVTFETARMLKEAEFGEVCHSFYDESSGTAWNMTERASMMSGWLPRPAQVLAARWLFERHGIFIEDYILVNGQFAYRLFRNGRNLVSEQSDMYESLQECIEDALQEALRLILKNKDNEQTND